MENKVSKGKTQRTELNSVTEHIEDSYALVIGFEVDEPEKTYQPIREVLTGKIEKYHYVVDEPGHTFIYLSKNMKITHFFSLGPLASQDGSEGGDLKRIYGRGTPDYWIPGETKLFRFALTKEEYEMLGKNIMIEREQVLSSEKNYKVIGNYTCAATARDIIVSVWPTMPKGESDVVLMGDRQGLELTGGVRVVNPYALYDDLVKWGGVYRVIPPRRKMWEKIMMGNIKKDPYFDMGDKNE